MKTDKNKRKALTMESGAAHPKRTSFGHLQQWLLFDSSFHLSDGFYLTAVASTVAVAISTVVAVFVFVVVAASIAVAVILLIG